MNQYREGERHRGRLIAALVAAGSFGWGLPAAADLERVRLVYERPPALEGCPDVGSLKQGVEKQLGYAPFDDAAPLVVSLEVTDNGRSIGARIESFAADGTPRGVRLLETHRECSTLGRVLELALALVVESLIEEARADANRVPRPPTHVRAAPPPPEQPRVERPPERRALLGVSVHVASGFAPTLAPGIAVRAGIVRNRLSFAVEARADGPSRVELAGGTLDVTLATLSALGCLHRWRLAACGLVTGGIQRGRGEGFDVSAVTVSPYVAAGPRVVVEIPLGRRLLGELRGDVLVPMTRGDFEVTGDPAGRWSTPTVGATAGLGVSGRFP